MSVKDVAARWDCHVGVVYRQVALGRLEALHIGGTIRISIAAVERFEGSNTTGI
ncbi:helix-turn-helix domain-containing protein [Rhodococcus qingshengii]|uniref:helix-turn-helix domain-containing protein n=1 Tax=Rhodococcus qingshengii TaxID=334542 RepID=UPI00389B14F9